MQLVAKARQAGLHLMPKDVFQHRSLREMARNLTASQGPARPAEPAGSNWLALPAQAWFLHRSWANPHWWNQMVGLSFSAGVSPGALRQALQTLGIRHRALGTRVGSHQNLSEGDTTPRLLELVSGSPANALTDHRALREAMHALQANMNLTEGPVWGAVLLRDANGQVRQCAIAIHHMVVDGYSWRVLFEELQTLLSGQSLGAVPPSASAVAAVLREHPTHLPSLAHWQAQARAAAALPTVPTWGMEGESVTYRLTLDADETRGLLRRIRACKSWYPVDRRFYYRVDKLQDLTAGRNLETGTQSLMAGGQPVEPGFHVRQRDRTTNLYFQLLHINAVAYAIAVMREYHALLCWRCR